MILLADTLRDQVKRKVRRALVFLFDLQAVGNGLR